MEHQNILPAAALTQHIFITGKAGSGKTYAGKLFVESILAEKKRVIIIDPTGVWWGLRSGRDGKKGGFPITVFGGKHADMPLNPKAGSALAEIIATSDLSAVLDVRSMTVGERTRFFTEFAETLLQKNIGPLHVVIDECHLFAPQGRVNDPQSGRMVGATNNLVSLGRASGLRVMMISQRPAKLHKDSLTQAETLIAMRMIAPQDRNAIWDWIGEWADKKDGDAFMKELPSLKTGTGWIWSPELGILEKKEFPRIHTYDSSSTPDGIKDAVVLKPVDLKSIEEKLQAVVTEAIENDPARLRVRITELEKANQGLQRNATGVSPAAYEQAKKIAWDAGHQDGYKEGMTTGQKSIINAIGPAHHILEKIMALQPGEGSQPAKGSAPITPAAVPVINANPLTRPQKENPQIGKCEGAILNVLAQFPKGRTKIQISLLSGYSSTSGGFKNSLSKLRGQGMIAGSDVITATPAGMALAVHEELPTGRALLDYWIGKLGKCEGAILNALYASYPGSTPKASIADQTGYSLTSGGFKNSLSKLRTLELMTGREDLQISNDFFQ